MLSVVIIAKDASQTLSACLKSIKNLADEILVVVDNRTTDNTALLAKSFGARVYSRKFNNYANQKNYAVSETANDWVLSLDADEEVSPELAAEIKRVLPGTAYAAFKIPRLNIIFGRPILHTNWEPSADTHIWLFDKTKCKWAGVVHEEIVTAGQVGTLRGHKIHHGYRTVEEFMDKMNDYTSREIKTANPFFEFLRRYIWHKGFLDGWHGLFLSYLMMIYHLSTRIKLWEKKNLSL